MKFIQFWSEFRGFHLKKVAGKIILLVRRYILPINRVNFRTIGTIARNSAVIAQTEAIIVPSSKLRKKLYPILTGYSFFY
ncbi:hypothetical protein G3A_02605 [Bacillus sp. 17376]|nr:hypothetical protein G3A_02605 [Bacillus sp. 17376]